MGTTVNFCYCTIIAYPAGSPFAAACGQLATVLTAGKVRCSPCSRYCAWLCSSHPLRCAPWDAGRDGKAGSLIELES